MRLKWFKNLRPKIQFFILLGLLFILLFLYIPLSKYIKPAILSSLSLPFKLSEHISSNASRFLKFQELAEENKSLKAQVAKLTAQLVQLQETSLENQRLRSLLSLSQRKSSRTSVAFLIGKDSSNWTQIVLINKGSVSGIKKGMPVVLGENLVGRVIEVAQNVSKVALIVDFNSKIPAKNMRTREEGVVLGTFEKGKSICKMKYIQEVKIGDEIISSGLGEIYPKGLLIGKVVAVEEEKDRLYKIAEIQPAVEFSTMEEVMVITGR